MALLKVGSKAPVFVTHLEFVDTKCQIFCQVGDIGGQADTLAERVAECVENGLASPISQCAVGDLCLALFHEDNSWYRGRVLQNLGHSLKVFFIDYGNTETVKMNNIREAPEYVLAIPALSTKCVVSDCTPLSGVWAEEEKKKIETMLHSGEFTCEIIGTDNSDVNNEVHKVKLYNNDAPNTPIFVRPASSSSQSLKSQSLLVGQEYEVYVSYVETARKFWVQLKNQENDLNSLMADIGACFAEDLPSTGDIVNPSDGQVCAACFSDDGAFYRGIVKNVQGGSCTVFFVDYGNKEDKRTSELFTLPQALCQLPMQSVPCAYHVESPAIEDKLHKLAEEDGPSLVKILSGNSSSGYIVEISSIEQMLKSSKVPTSKQTGQTKSAAKMWESYTSVVMQVDGNYDVCVSHVDHPGQFCVQLLGNASNLDKLAKAVDEVAHNYDKLSNLYQGYPCLAKFSDNSWYRGEVIASEVGKTTVAAVDFGFVEALPPSQLRNTDPNFKLQPAQAVRCTIDLDKLEQGQWKTADIERFKALVENIALVAKVSAKKGYVHQIDLYETEKGEERHLNAEFNNVSQTVAPKVTTPSQPRALQVAAAPRVTLLPPEVSVGSKYTLCFTAVKSQYIYGQLTSTPVEKIAKLQTELNTFFDKKGESILGLEVGSVCCTQYVDGGWYRGMVTSVAGGKAEVAFVDFGDSVMKSSSDLKVLPPNLCGLSQQCILCKIDNVPPSSDKLEKLVNKRAEVVLTGKEDGVYPTFGAQITEKRVLDQIQGSASSQQAVFKGASSRTFSRPPRDETSAPRGMTGRKPSGDGYTHQEVAVNSTQEVMVTYVKDPSNFQVVLDKMSASLDVVMDQLHEYYDVLPPGGDKLENPRLSQPCVAQFTEDSGWYRGLITGLKVDGQAEVMYVDYGNNEYTDKDALKVIKKQFMSLPAQAVQCRLSGVSSSQGFWSPEHIVKFTEMVEEQSFVATFKAEVREQGELAYKVELVDKKGTNINETFGTMTGTTCPETDTGPSSRSVTATKLGQDMKITVGGGDSGWNEDGNSGASSGFGSKPRSFGGGGGRQPNGGSSGFGSRSSGFVSKPGGSTGGDSGWNDEGGSGETSSGFGGKKPFGGGDSRGGGFGGSGGRGVGFGGGGGRGGGFGGGGRGGFGGSQGGSGGFGSSSGNGGASAGGGFGSSGGSSFGGGGGGSRDCFKCGESGHFSRECPNPAKGGGGRDCYKCGEAGHMARDCTNPPKGGGGRDCYKCGEAGHMARDCTNPPKGGGGGRDCFKCGESGHMARDCTNPPKAGGGGGRECYKCGESGHMARDCTNPPKEGAGPRRGFGGSSERSSGFGNRGGGFGSRGNEGSENWGDGDSKGGSSGFSSRGGSGGFGSRGGSGGGFQSGRGGFGGRSGDSGGGFGSRGSSGGGFGKKDTEDDWGSSESSNKPATGGFGGSNTGGFGGGDRAGFGRQSSGFGKNAGGGGDDWGIEAAPTPIQVASPAGDGPCLSKVGNDASFTIVTLDTKETVDVYVVYVSSPDDFWCQVIKNSQNLEKLMEEMNSFYNGLPEGDLVLAKPEVGTSCAAMFSEDSMWYRAEVLSQSQLQVEVQFVDYGNTETVPVDKLRKLKPEYLSLKAQGIKCSLDDVIASDKSWTKKAVEDFEDLTQDKHLVAKVINRTSDMIHILDLENLDEKVNIAETMCEKGHCSFKSMKTSPVKEKVVQSPYPVAEIQAGQEIDVYVSWIESPEQFWVQPVSQENDLVELVEKIQEIYTTGAGANLKIDSLVPGQAVVAQFSEDEAWYRSYMEKMSGGKYKVRFTDYGNSDMVDTESVRLPTEELLKESSKAALCKLVGIRPLQAGQWTADSRDIMDGLVKDEVVRCKIVEISKGQFSVELVSKGVDVRQELIQAAVVREEKETSPGAGPQLRSSTSRLTYNNQMQWTVGTTEGVFISHTDSVASFWCQPVRTAGELEEVMAQLETHCKSGTGLQDFPVDMACAAKFSEDENWYRAKVTAVYPDDIEVLFVDYGNTEKVPKSDICELTEELVQLPTQAVECELVNSGKASNQLTAKFLELIGELEAQATVVDVQDESAIVSLTLPSGKVVGEELGLSEPGSTPPLPPSPVKTSTNEPVQVKAEPQVYIYSKTSMPSAPTMVFVTQIINAGEFYVQLVERESQLNEMMAELSKYCQSEDAQQVSSLSVGQACCAKFSDDDGWYRAKVLKVEGSNVSVEFVDYGNWETTTTANVRSILPKFVKAEPFVLKCSLEGILPLNESWSEESTKRFEELAVEKDLSCETVEGSEVILKCGDTDISEALVESGVAKRAEGSKRPANSVSMKDLSYSKPTLPTEVVDVYISHVNSPGDLYVQLVNQEDQLNELMEKLAQLYESTTDSPKIDSVSQGQAVCAKYSDDEAWYRAEVTQVDGNSVTVLFVDYGNSEETTLDSLRALKVDLVKAPRYAIRCNLNAAQPAEGEWSEESVIFFETKTSEKVLQCEFVVGYNVCLKLDGTDVVDELVEKGYASKMVEIFSPSKPKCQFTPQSVPADSVSCYVSHVDDNGTIYVQLVCEEDTLNTVVEEVQTFESGRELVIEEVRKGDLVCARFSEDQSWYRAVVISAVDSTATVRFVDYGNCDDVKQSSDLKALPESLQITPPLAYVCQLQGLKSLNSSQVELLREATADKELTVTFNTSSPEYEVHLEDENQQDFVQILGGAVGNREQEVVEEAVLAGVEVEASQETPEVGQVATDNVDSESGDTVPDVNLDDITDKVVELQSVKLAVEQRVKVQVGHAESPSKLWVQLESDKEKLESLLNTMYDLYSNCSDKRLTIELVCKDMVVAALYDEDESWYRAKVVDCDNEDVVTVMFLDHGNTEVVSRDSLRKLPTEFCQLPVQAIECRLGAVQPSQELWSEDAKQAFTDLTVDKVLLLDVGSVNEQGVYTVQLLDMGMSIGDQLLQKDVGVQIATPVAVSTKVKQVFSPDTADDVIARLYSAKPSESVGQYGYKLRDLAETDPTISSQSVLVTAINSPVDFWCRLEDNSYEFYQDKLQENYSENREQLAKINEGDKCVVCVKEKEFYRGTVLNKSEEGVNVKLVDIGNILTVSESDLFGLKAEFDTYPQLAFSCSFTCIGPAKGDKFTEDACKVFKETVLELSNVSELPGSGKATIVAEENGIVLIELTIDRKDVAESLVEKGVVKFDESKNLSVLNDQDEIDDISENFGAFKNVQLDTDNDFHVVMIDCSDMDRLVFHGNDSLPALKEIEQLIGEAVSDKVGGEGIDDLTSGPCLAKRPDDNTWNRANLRCIDQKASGEDSQESYKVFLVDDGSTYDLPKTNILPMPGSLLDKPGQAVICCLDEIEPFDDEWDEECYNLFTEQYMSEDSGLVVYVNSYNKGIHKVLLSARDQAEKSVNHLLVDIGLAAPRIGSQMEMSVIADTAETSFHELSMSRQDSYGDSTELGDTSFEPDSSCLIDTSCLTEDTSYTTEGDTTGYTEVDTSCLTEGDTSCVTEGDTSNMTDVDTSCITDADTSRFTEGDTSYEGEVSGLSEGNTSQFTDVDTTNVTEGDTSRFTEGDTTDVTESEGDTSVNTLDGTRWVCEDCSEENDVDEPMMECQHCHSVRKDHEYVAIRELVKEELQMICKNIEQIKESINDRGGINEEIIGNNGNVKSLPSSYLGVENASESDEKLIKETVELETSNLEASSYSTSDIDPRSTEESDLDLSYRPYDYSPTGYTTSELDTTELREVDETTDTADFDTTGLTDYDTTGIEGGGEELSIYEEEDLNESNGFDKRKHEDENSTGIKKQKTADDDKGSITESCNEDGAFITDDNSIEERNNKDTGDADIRTKDMLKEDEIPLFIPIPQQSKVSNVSVSEQAFPSVSDATYPSTLTSVSDFTFTSAYDTSQSSMICDDCKQDFSSCLETTGCESEFSFYVCAQCQQDRNCKYPETISESEDAGNVVEYIEHDENVQKMIELAEEVFTEEDVNKDVEENEQRYSEISPKEETKDVNDNEVSDVGTKTSDKNTDSEEVILEVETHKVEKQEENTKDLVIHGTVYFEEKIGKDIYSSVAGADELERENEELNNTDMDGLKVVQSEKSTDSIISVNDADENPEEMYPKTANVGVNEDKLIDDNIIQDENVREMIEIAEEEMIRKGEMIVSKIVKKSQKEEARDVNDNEVSVVGMKTAYDVKKSQKEETLETNSHESDNKNQTENDKDAIIHEIIEIEGIVSDVNGNVEAENVTKTFDKESKIVNDHDMNGHKIYVGEENTSISEISSDTNVNDVKRSTEPEDEVEYEVISKYVTDTKVGSDMIGEKGCEVHEDSKVTSDTACKVVEEATEASIVDTKDEGKLLNENCVKNNESESAESRDLELCTEVCEEIEKMPELDSAGNIPMSPGGTDVDAIFEGNDLGSDDEKLEQSEEPYKSQSLFGKFISLVLPSPQKNKENGSGKEKTEVHVVDLNDSNVDPDDISLENTMPVKEDLPVDQQMDGRTSVSNILSSDSENSSVVGQLVAVEKTSSYREDVVEVANITDSIIQLVDELCDEVATIHDKKDSSDDTPEGARKFHEYKYAKDTEVVRAVAVNELEKGNSSSALELEMNTEDDISESAFVDQTAGQRIDIDEEFESPYGELESEICIDVLDSKTDDLLVKADSQYISEKKTEKDAEKSKEESNKDEDSDKEDFEDAPENDADVNVGNTDEAKDLNTSSPERESVETGDSESFYDVEEEDKSEEDKTD